MPDFSQVDAAYRELLGRSLSEGEFVSWAGNDNYRNEIAGSPEARAYRDRTRAPLPADVAVRLPEPPEGFDRSKWFSDHQSEKYTFGRLWQTQGLEAAARAVGATVLDPQTIRTASGRIIDLYRASSTEGFAHPQWLDVTEQSPGGAAPPAPFVLPALIPGGSPLSRRGSIVARANNEFGRSSSGLDLAEEQASRNGRSLVSGGSFEGTANGFTAGMGADPGQAFPTRPARQPNPAPRRKRNPFSRALRGIGHGVAAVGRGIGRSVRAVVTNPIGLAALGVAGAAFLPGVGPGIRAALGKAGRGLAKSALALGKRTTRGAIAAGHKAGSVFSDESDGSVATPPFVAPSARVQVWSVDQILATGFYPEPPFEMVMMGGVETVIDAQVQPNGLPVFFLDPDGYPIDLVALVQAEQQMGVN
jgi:hypothetical protein